MYIYIMYFYIMYFFIELHIINHGNPIRFRQDRKRQVIH
jgi:hypothetical protein